MNGPCYHGFWNSRSCGMPEYKGAWRVLFEHMWYLRGMLIAHYMSLRTQGWNRWSLSQDAGEECLDGFHFINNLPNLNLVQMFITENMFLVVVREKGPLTSINIMPTSGF